MSVAVHTQLITDPKLLTDAQLKEANWRLGKLRWKLKRCQRSLYDAIEAVRLRGGRRFVGRCPRRFGKSYVAAILAIEKALTTPNAVIHWAALSRDQVQKLAIPNFRTILKDCPADLKPELRDNSSVYRFPSTGSEIHLAGCEDRSKADRLLGSASHFFIIDEAGHIGDGGGLLNYVIDSVALPQTLTTDGFILELSTAPVSPAHPFRAHCLLAEAGGYGIKRTIHDSTRFSPAKIAEYMHESGGEDSIVWQREYLSEFVVEESRAIYPQFARNKDAIVQEFPRPEFFKTLAVMDLGFAPDLTVVLFGHYDFARASLVVEDELVLSRTLTDELARALRAKEQEVWGKPADFRFGDIEPLVAADLAQTHGLFISPVQKHDKQSALNEAQIWMRTGRFFVHPRCSHTIGSLEAGIWNTRRTSFERLDGFGHFDACDAACYGIRVARDLLQHSNPFPLIPSWMNDGHHHIPRGMQQAQQRGAYGGLADLFNPGRGR